MDLEVLLDDALDDATAESGTEASTPEDLGLEEVNVAADEQNLSDDLIYPCLVIGGITTTEELEFFINREVKTKDYLPLFIQFEDIVKRAGDLDVNLEVFQILNSVSKYTITLHKTPTENVLLDLNDANTFIKLIKL